MSIAEHKIDMRQKTKQGGATLFIAMIFLLIFGAMAAASLSVAFGSTQAIANMQWRNESLGAANAVISKILSGTRFTTDTTFATSVNNATGSTKLLDLTGSGSLNRLSFDVNGDSIDDIVVSMPSITFDGTAKAGPRCIKYSTVPVSSLNTAVAADLGCFGTANSDSSGYSTETSSGSYDINVGAKSICANTEWIIPVRATDAVTKTTVDVMQGSSVRVFISDAQNACQ